MCDKVGFITKFSLPAAASPQSNTKHACSRVTFFTQKRPERSRWPTALKHHLATLSSTKVPTEAPTLAVTKENSKALSLQGTPTVTLSPQRRNGCSVAT